MIEMETGFTEFRSEGLCRGSWGLAITYSWSYSHTYNCGDLAEKLQTFEVNWRVIGVLSNEVNTADSWHYLFRT